MTEKTHEAYICMPRSHKINLNCRRQYSGQNRRELTNGSHHSNHRINNYL